MNSESYDLMCDIDERYRAASGLKSRAFYSIFYGPLRPCPLLVINANPGGTPTNFRIVDVLSGEHEYIEGRLSGPTTKNGAEILQTIVGSSDIRSIQVLNRFFRRSPTQPMPGLQKQYALEARPFLAELIEFIQPEALLFGGNAGVLKFTEAHSGQVKAAEPIFGPNGSFDAVYFQEYGLKLPYYREIPAHGIYHPSNLKSVFRERVYPLLKDKLGPLFAG